MNFENLRAGSSLELDQDMNKIRVYLTLIILAILHASCGPPQGVTSAQLQTAIPNQADWVDCGAIFSSGAEGEWDLYLWGGFANSVVHKDGVFYLYYQGSNGYDEDEGTVTWRSIGVATSPDGIHFTKYEHNPVLTWFPRNHFEEGAVSSGALIDENGDIAIYYGANTWAGGSYVNADGRLAVSSDGYKFTDVGIVLDHSDYSTWGAGDELFPIIGIHDSGRWVTYYIPNGVPQGGRLGVAWGERRDSLVKTSSATSKGSLIPVWGSGSHVKLDGDIYALFLNNLRGPNGPVTEVRTVSLRDPNLLSTPLKSYQFGNTWQASVYFNEETQTWHMYYHDSDHDRYGLRLASADGRAIACPSSQVYLPLLGRQGQTDASSLVFTEQENPRLAS